MSDSKLRVVVSKDTEETLLEESKRLEKAARARRAKREKKMALSMAVEKMARESADSVRASRESADSAGAEAKHHAAEVPSSTPRVSRESTTSPDDGEDMPSITPRDGLTLRQQHSLDALRMQLASAESDLQLARDTAVGIEAEAGKMAEWHDRRIAARQTFLLETSQKELNEDLARIRHENLCELEKWLVDNGLYHYRDGIVDELEVTSLADLKFVQELDLDNIQMAEVKKRRFFAAVAALARSGRACCTARPSCGVYASDSSCRQPVCVLM